MLECFREVVAVDFEFIATAGNRPVPVCLVAHELRRGRRFRVWQDQFGPAPPYATGTDVLFVAYYASAELGCCRVLGWPMPERILDLFTEFRARTNGLNTPAGSGLLGALAYFGLDGIGATEKDDMRALILRGGPWSDAERLAILDYCEGDVDALRRLLVPSLFGQLRGTPAAWLVRESFGQRRRLWQRSRALIMPLWKEFSSCSSPLLSKFTVSFRTYTVWTATTKTVASSCTATLRNTGGQS